TGCQRDHRRRDQGDSLARLRGHQHPDSQSTRNYCLYFERRPVHVDPGHGARACR
ncbi:DLST, partial [Symbiodinium pilosum]